MSEKVYRDIECPNCANKISYWTTRDYIICAPCKTRIPVEPMPPLEDQDADSDGEPVDEQEVMEDGADI